MCPVCRGDYLLGKSEVLPTKYLGVERQVGVCPTCAGNPPRDYRRKLRVALERFPWGEEGDEERIGEASVVSREGEV